MTINLGKLDVVVRFTVGAGSIVVGAYMAFVQNNVYGLALGFSGGILMVTGVIRWCPVYALLGLNSCPMSTEKSSCS